MKKETSAAAAQIDECHGRAEEVESFDLGDWQVIIAGTMGRDMTTAQIGDLLQPQLNDQRSTLVFLAKMVHGFCAKRLLDKIYALSDAENVEKQTKITEFHAQTPIQDLFGSDLWPDPSILRMAGLVKLISQPVWGYCVIRLDDDKYLMEVVLRYDRNVEAQDYAADELAEICVSLVRDIKNNPAQSALTWLHDACSHLVVATEFRHPLVV